MGTIRFQVISLQGIYIDEMVDFFKFQGPKGQTGVLKDHAPLLTLMKAGRVTYQTRIASKTFHTLGGIVEFKDNKAVLLADYCSENQSDLLTLQASQKAKSHRSDRSEMRSFHQLYAQLARSPEEMEALKGIGQLNTSYRGS